MNKAQIASDLFNRGFKSEVSTADRVLCSLPKPFQDYGLCIESFGSDWVSCRIWESCGGVTLGSQGFKSLDSMIAWAFFAVANFDAVVSDDLASMPNLR